MRTTLKQKVVCENLGFKAQGCGVMTGIQMNSMGSFIIINKYHHTH